MTDKKAKTPMTPGRKRALLISALAIVMVVAFIIVPAYVATRPGFLGRYPDLKPRVDTWHSSVHVAVPCQGCHISPRFTAQAAYSARMLGEFYLSLVVRSRQPDLLGKPTNAACSKCHFDLRTVSPSGDLNIPHRAHVSVLKLKCVSCHEFLVHEKSPEGKHAPRMVACLKCHDGKQAKNACTTCHTGKGAPKNHAAADWIVVHPDKQKELDCAECHAWTEDWCVECHSRRPESHVEKWRSVHRDAVKARRNCEACHEGEFCTRCHGEVPQLNFDPALKRVQ